VIAEEGPEAAFLTDRGNAQSFATITWSRCVMPWSGMVYLGWQTLEARWDRPTMLLFKRSVRKLYQEAIAG